MTSNGYAGHRQKKSASVKLLRKVQTDGGGKGSEGFQWTPVPFKVSGNFPTDIPYDILLLVKLRAYPAKFCSVLKYDVLGSIAYFKRIT